MEKGHIGFRELIVISLLILGFAAALFLLMGGKGAPTNPPEANTSLSNATAPEPQTASPETEAIKNATTPASPAPSEVTNKSVGALLDEGLGRADSRFYASVVSGEYDINSFRWAMGKFNDTPDSIPVKENDLRAVPIRFDGRYVDSIRGFAFKTYYAKNLTAPPLIFGTAVFLANSTPLDSNLEEHSELTIQYDPHPEGTQVMEGCKILSGTDMLSVSGAAIKVYDFSCKLMYGALP